jgi:hypothetical protein
VEQRILRWAYAIMVASISLLMLIAVLLFIWHVEDATPWEKMSAAEWGVWAGSIGTVATLIGTIILATADKRAARREAHDRAVVAAASLGPRLSSLHQILNNFIENLRDDKFEKTQIQYASMAILLKAKHLWTNDDILPLIVLPGHVCTRLAGGRTLFEQLVSDMEDLAQTWSHSYVQEQLYTRQGKILGNMIACREIVAFAAGECKNAVRSALHT